MSKKSKNRQYTEQIQMANKHNNNVQYTSNQINKIKTTKYHFLKIKKMIILNVDEGAVRRALSYIAARSVNWYNLSGKQFGNMHQES